MTETRVRRVRRDDNGTALVELPLAFVVLTALALTITALGQLFLDYHHVTGAARAAARYATKSDYDPTAAPSSSRRPSPDEVVAFATQSAAPLTASKLSVGLAPDTQAGDGLTVDIRYAESGGAYGLITTTARRLFNLIGLDIDPNVSIHATATALYE